MPEKLDANTAISNLKAKYPNYNFDKFEFKSANTPGVVVCPQHGEVLRTYKDLRRTTTACPKCASNVRGSKETFVAEVIELIKNQGLEPPEKYDFSKVEYKNALENVTITCKIHGNFDIRPYSVKSKLATSRLLCTFCSIKRRAQENKPKITANTDPSGDESRSQLFNFIKSIISDVKNKYELVDCGIDIDVYIPEKKLGIQYKTLCFNRKLSDLDHISEPSCKLHLNTESKLAQKAGIRLIHIFEDEWLGKKKIVENRLKSILGLSERIYARNCEVKEIEYSDGAEFLRNNHIQGNAIPSHSFGLYHNNELVAVMTFSKWRYVRTSDNWDYELLRFASSQTVVGGFSKLLKAFINSYRPRVVHSYSDRRWSEGNVYKQNGFIHIHSTAPGYFWCKNQERHNRMNFTKLKLTQMFGKNAVARKTESQIMYEHGYFKVEDCGQDLWDYVPKP